MLSKKICHGSENAAIDKLPLSAIQRVLCFLPIQEAGRTSVLSKEWEHHWKTIPTLVFDECTHQSSSDTGAFSQLEQSFNEIPSQRREMSKRCKLFSAIFQVLLKHTGPIVEFGIDMEADVTCVEIDQILSSLSKQNTVKKLVLDLNGHGTNAYRLPSSMFSFAQLTDLRLVGCLLNRQPQFSGFHNLTDLFMELTLTTKRTLLHLLSGCPLVKSLTVTVNNFLEDDNSNITNLFMSLPMVEKLVKDFMVIQAFLVDQVPRVLPAPLTRLSYVSIDLLSFTHAHALSFLVFLVRNSPHLETLLIKVCDEESTSFSQSVGSPSILQDNLDITLAHLKVLDIVNITNVERGELDFIKLILARSPNLEKVDLSLWYNVDEDEKSEILQFILMARRASPIAQVIVDSTKFHEAVDGEEDGDGDEEEEEEEEEEDD